MVINKIDSIISEIEKSSDLYKSLKLARGELTTMLQNIKMKTLVFFKNYYD